MRDFDLSQYLATLDLRHRAFNRALGPLPLGVSIHYATATTNCVTVSGVLDYDLLERLLKALHAASEIPLGAA